MSIFRATLALFATIFSTVINCAEPGNTVVATGAATNSDALPSYWLRQQEGWFWYRDPSAPPTAQSPTAQNKEIRPKELIEFEAMQKRLDDLKRIAVMNPSDANMTAYMGYQRYVMDKSAYFADSWQRLVWKTPELDYALSGRPTNSFAIDAFDTGVRGKQRSAIQALARTHGLFFIFRSDCPYCHKFAPVLKRFEANYGLTVFPVSLDGGGLPEYPSAMTDNGIATKLEVRVVPAVFLAVPGSGEITPIGYGVMAEEELAERIYTITQTKPGQAF